MLIVDIGGGSTELVWMDLSEISEENRIAEGDLVVTVAFGGGLAWGANLIQF